MAFINFHNIRMLFGKTKVRSQMCLIATEDGRLLPAEIPVKKGCAVDEEKISAFLLDAANLIKDEISGIAYQLVGERTAVPICLIKPRDQFKRKAIIFNEDGKKINTNEGLWGLIKGVFHDSWVSDLIILNREGEKMKREGMLYIILGSVVPLAALLIAIKMIRG